MQRPGLSSPLMRMACLILAVSLLDCAIVLCVKKPLPLAAIIPALIPLLTVPVVILPVLREKNEKKKS